MNTELSATVASRLLSRPLSWQPLLAMAQAVFWPGRWLAIAWLLAIGLCVIGTFSTASQPLVLGIAGLLSLHLVIPIQINNLSRKKSWLLLPDFKMLLLTLLLLMLALWLIAMTAFKLLVPLINWLVLPYGALIFSLVMLPAIYMRHLWPLLAELLILVAIGARPDVKIWLAANGTTLWFVSVIVAITVSMWLWMAYRWLNTNQRDSAAVKRTSLFALYGIEIPWLLRLTRQSASLQGTLLLGDGDSWSASLVRALWATWLAPVIFLLIDIIFTNQGKPPTRLWTAQAFLVLLTLAPLFTLAAQQQKSTQRLGRCWLFLAGCRQSMYGFAERAFYQEFIAYLAMTLVLLLVLVPYPMILPLLCYGASATLLLCYLIFALAGRTFWWSVSANLLLLITLMVAMDYLWMSPNLIYLTSLVLILPVYSLRRYGKAYWLKLDYSQLKPRQLL